VAFTGRPIRVLVVEDSARLRTRIVDTLSADPEIVVVAQAADGRSAIDLCQELRPDVVTMDVMLPVVTGLVATEQLMQRCPTPILIISAATDPGALVNTFAALAAGAVDVLEKPRARAGSDADWNRRLVATVKMVARIQVITHLAPSAGTPPARPLAVAGPEAGSEAGSGAGRHVMRIRPRTEIAGPASVPVRRSHPGAFSVVAIGASTGGPAAVAAVLRDLPETFFLPILLVLHVSDTFGPAIANWLKASTGRQVRLADQGEPIREVGGQVIMAPPGRHLVVRDGLIGLTDDRERHSCRPSVDVLFESLAHESGPRVAACLLTGMGRDGAAGLLEVHRRGVLTIAQDEASSVVFGMPGEAVRLGAAQHVVPVEQIGPLLARLTTPVVRPR
jgi:two-component system chemotaxis response regulator CheB